jgi:hypothetical protein
MQDFKPVGATDGVILQPLLLSSNGFPFTRVVVIRTNPFHAVEQTSQLFDYKAIAMFFSSSPSVFARP